MVLGISNSGNADSETMENLEGKIKMGKQTVVKNYIVFALLALGVLLIYSFSTSPIYPYAYGWDSDFFRLVGEGMLEGYIPYRDFFDMKGPWLFFLECIGQMVCVGKLGAFFIQYVHLLLVLIVCYKINSKFWNQKTLVGNIIAFIPMFIIYAATMEGGNLTEDLGLLYLFIPLYFSLDFIRNDREEHRPIYALIYGCCFGILAQIRLTNSVLICAIVLTILIELIKKKKWNNILLNMLYFIVGVVIVFIPTLLYFGYYGEIESMFYCTFVFGFIYAVGDMAFGAGKLLVLTLFLTPVLLYLTGEKNKKFWILILSNIAGMLAILSMGIGNMHDYMLIIPGVMLGIWELLANWKDVKCSKIIVLAIVGICFLYPTYKLAGATKSLIFEKQDSSCWECVQETVEYIPEEERDSVWGFVIPVWWYTMADIMPCNKYLAWQERYMELSDNIKDEIYDMMDTEPPTWIVTRTKNEINDLYIKNELATEYAIIVENEEFRLFRRQ